jgi:hypothetical protein
MGVPDNVLLTNTLPGKVVFPLPSALGIQLVVIVAEHVTTLPVAKGGVTVICGLA